jgi:urease accessory protein
MQADFAPIETWLPWLLQACDSQFPSGSYAHSLGLEELTQHGLITNADDVERFVQHQILPSLCAFELPFLVQAHQAAARESVEALHQLDEELEAWKLAAELRQASRQIGSRRLALVRKLQQGSFIEAYAQLSPPSHHLIVAALELRHTPVHATLAVFGFQTIAGYTSASMKLVRMGQERSQSILHGAMKVLAPRLPQIAQAPADRIGWFNPLLEIASMRHACARERLFIS